MIREQEVPYLGIYGISGVSVNEADQLPRGIFVQQVESRSPAYQGKLRVADMITEVDGHAMQTMEDLHAYLAECQSGQEITVTIYRQGNSQLMKKILKITLK